MTKEEKMIQKALCLCIGMDMMKSALSSVGTINTADKSKTTLICFEEMSKQFKEGKKNNG